MITNATILYLYTETPLHVGTGSGLSNIDLPIQRERTTPYPMIQGSSIKGKMRATAELLLEEQESKKKENNASTDQETTGSSPVAQQNTSNNFLSRQDIELLFGSSKPGTEKTNNNTNISNTSATTEADKKGHAGSLIFGDARLLLFPVRSLNGIFAYTTCYCVLDRFLRDMEKTSTGSLMGKNSSGQLIELQVPQEPKQDESGIPKALVTKSNMVAQGGKLMLEEFAFTASSEQQDMVTAIADWLATNTLPQYQNNTYFQEKLKNSLVILPDNEFRDFALYATEVITRIAIDRLTKTVTGTALWTEENLPTDTLLYVPVYATDSRMPDRHEKGPAIIQKARSDNGTLESEYCSRARGLNAMIQQNGLGTTLGFLKAKSKIEKNEKGTILRDKKGRPRYNAPYLLLQHLSEWMKVQNFVPTNNEYQMYDGLLLWITNIASSDDYRRSTTECLAFGLWLRRFAEAELKEKSENSTTTEPTETEATEGGAQ